jgi:Glutamate-ammonia ligase adenylyltransferase
MDSGGTSLTNRRDYVAELAASQEVAFDGLTRARERSRREIDRLGALLAEAPALPKGVAVVAMGSVGRHEMTQASDIDFVVLSVHDEAEGAHAAQVARRIAEAGYDMPAAGGSFSQPARAEELAAVIGRDAERNFDLTQRMLLILESVPLTNPDVHRAATARLRDAYLGPNLRDRRPPRFFLNDVIRYWRTICVDFEGKMRARQAEGWVIRNAKLRTLRKMLFAGGLIPLLECQAYAKEEMGDFLESRFAITPADRLAAAAMTWGAPEGGANALGSYSQMLEILDEPEKRQELEEMPQETRADSSLWSEVERLGHGFQRGIEDVLRTTALQPGVWEYAVF